MLKSLAKEFTVTVEVVPPAGPDSTKLLDALSSLDGSTFYGFSVATNPVAKARMSSLAMSALIQKRTGKPAILHCTTRDHNRLSLQGLLWGARGLGIGTVLVATGDHVTTGSGPVPTTVQDVDVFTLVKMAIPILMGILPLRTSRHAEFLHNKVSGITVPNSVRQRIGQSTDPTAEGAAAAGEMLLLARRLFGGACIMPPFNHYEVVGDILRAREQAAG